MDFTSSTRAAENRTRWRGIVANSSVGPHDLPRLWDRKKNRIECNQRKQMEKAYSVKPNQMALEQSRPCCSKHC